MKWKPENATEASETSGGERENENKVDEREGETKEEREKKRKIEKKCTSRDGKTLTMNSQVNKRTANKNNEQKTKAHTRKERK